MKKKTQEYGKSEHLGITLLFILVIFFELDSLAHMFFGMVAFCLYVYISFKEVNKDVGI